MRISDFDYTLPEANIAQFPPEKRGTTRLLVLDREKGTMKHRHYFELTDLIQSGDVVVLNDTRVIKARLLAKNHAGKERELLLLESHGNDNNWKHHKVLYRGKVHQNEILEVQGVAVKVTRILGDGIANISSDENLLELADQFGAVPLPPYMKRTANLEDTRRYQTEFAVKAGSVAAPTASLNFTNELKNKLTAKGVKIVYLTLHVGLGTFLPIRSASVENHTMHSEYFEIPAMTIETIKLAKDSGRKIIAVGTTVARTLEFAATKYPDIFHASVINSRLSGEANIFIYPGYEFKIIDALLTNFHAPRSTVLMLAAAFGGWDNMQQAYQEALRRNYTFLSYGDSMFIG
jgi:S-adenosylmethionine:tRNA ribosyltransferase-isomerase